MLTMRIKVETKLCSSLTPTKTRTSLKLMYRLKRLKAERKMRYQAVLGRVRAPMLG